MIDVIKVQDITNQDYIDRELMLIKVNAGKKNRAELIQIVDTFKAKIIDVNPESLTIEIAGEQSKIDAIMELLMPFGIREIVRTGRIAMARKKEVTIKKSP